MSTLAAGTQAPGLGTSKVRAYLRLGKARIYHHGYGVVLAGAVLHYEGRLRAIDVAALTAMLVGMYGLQWATGSADDIGGFRDGSDAINYAGRPAFTVAKKPLLTGALTEREAITFAVGAFIVGVVGEVLAVVLLGGVPLGAGIVFTLGALTCVQYSVGLRISYRPLGLETQVLVSTALLVLLPHWVAARSPSQASLLVSALMGVWFLLVVSHGNASDRQGDAAVNRRTLAVLLPDRAFRAFLFVLFLASVALITALFVTTLRSAAIVTVAPVIAVHAAQQYFGAFKQEWRRARFLGLVSLDVGSVGLVLALLFS